MIDELKKDLEKLSNKKKAKILSGFFKTGKGDYGEGDIFLGVVVPEQRKIASKYNNLEFKDMQELLSSKIHEHRLTSLLILNNKYKKASDRKEIVEFYLKNTKNINNWDLVDISAPKILGDYFFDRDKKRLYDLAKSNNLWEKRIAVLSTFWFIKNNKFDDSLKIAEILLYDKHDLIHKAVGWMLREIGKRDSEVEEKFLNKHYNKMPRTMLRYAIENFSYEKRRFYLD